MLQALEAACIKHQHVTHGYEVEHHMLTMPDHKSLYVGLTVNALRYRARYQVDSLTQGYQAMHGVHSGPWEARTAAGEGAAGRFKDAIARHLAAAGELQASRHAAC